MTCNGNSSEICGGPNRLNVYNYTGTDLPVNNGGGNAGGGGPATVFPVLSGLPTGWAYNACWMWVVSDMSKNCRWCDTGSDNANGRILQNQIPDDQNMTVELCVETCAAQNFTVAGLEFSSESFLFRILSANDWRTILSPMLWVWAFKQRNICCHYVSPFPVCGPNLVAGAVIVDDSSCNMACGGNATYVVLVLFVCVKIWLCAWHLVKHAVVLPVLLFIQWAKS